MKLFRLIFIIPVILLLGIFGTLIYLLKDGQIKSYLEQNVDGLNIESLQTNLKDGEVHFNMGGDFSDNLTKENLINLENIHGSMDFHALGFGSVIIPSMKLDGLQIQPQFYSYLSKEDDSSANLQTESSGNTDQKDDSMLPGFDLDNFDRHEWLERFTGQRELASEKHIKSIQERGKKLKDIWENIDTKEKGAVKSLVDKGQNMVKDWKNDKDVKDIQKKIDDLKKTFESLKGQKFDKNNIQGLLANVEKIKNLQNETKSIQSMIKDAQTAFKNKLGYVNEVKAKAKELSSLPGELKKDVDGFQKDLKELPKALEQDKKLLKEELNFKNFDAEKITRLLFGKEWSDELKTYLDMWYKVQEYLPASEDEAQANSELSHEELLALPVEFTRSPALPDWALKHLSYTGRSEQHEGETINFQGNINNISSHEQRLGASPSFDMFGKIAGSKGGTLNATGVFSNIEKTTDKRNIQLKLSGRQIVDKVLGNGSSQMIIEKGQLAADIHVDLAKVPYIKGDISIALSNAVFKAGPDVKPMLKDTLVQSLQKTFAEPLLVSFEYQKDWKSPKLKIEDRMNKVFQDAAKALVSSFAKEQESKLMSDLTSKMNGNSASMLKGLNLTSLLNGDTSSNLKGLSTQLMANLNTWNKSKTDKEKGLSTQQDLLNQLIGSMTKENSVLSQQKGGLEQQAKNMLQEKLGNKLLEGLGSKKEENPKEEEKKTDPKKDIKEGLKSLENTFKGLF